MTDISVPCWNDVDIEELCNGARLIAFDLDNTLARSKKPMKDDMAECFSALTSLIDVAVITGGKYALLKSQVVERLTGQACRSHLHLMPTTAPDITVGTDRIGRRSSPMTSARMIVRKLTNRWNAMRANRVSGSRTFGVNVSRIVAARSHSPH